MASLRQIHCAVWKRDVPGPGLRGFTLVELLVVITIIGILMGLMLPAVMAVVNQARRARCLSNIDQIGKAMHNYHTSFAAFPGNWGKVGENDFRKAATQPAAMKDIFGQSWMTALLPNLELNPLFNSINKNGTGNDNATAAQTRVPAFICTADGSPPMTSAASGVAMAVTNYKAVAGANWGGTGSSSTATCKAHPYPPGPSYGGRNASTTDGLDDGDGVICRGGSVSPTGNPPWPTRIEDIKDGTTHTFAVGEVVPQYCKWTAWYWFDGSTATCGIPLNYTPEGTRPGDSAGNWLVSYGFSSVHRGGANFCMCDGSGHFIPDNIAPEIYHYLATIDGGEQAEIP
jgi:prepilin-type N-terminal cleavage/methylation domain-containing protein/prepilin-type processing-associated H-X9-DG protein